jgi:FeS assembly protein IscX
MATEFMPEDLNWDNAEELGYLLSERYPDLDPLNVQFTDLLRWVTELPSFSGKAEDSNEGRLEAIQKAWLDEYRDRAS